MVRRQIAQTGCLFRVQTNAVSHDSETNYDAR